MPIFMKYDGIDKGSSTTKGHLGSSGWTELSSVQWGVGRGITNASQGQEREASAPSVSEIVVTKLLDLSSYRLFEESLTGDGKTVTIHFTKTNKDQQETYMEYVLSNTLVSGFSTNGSGDRPMETVSLNFTKIEYNYTGLDAKNDKGETPKASWDLAQLSKS
jgi:type VI secretion system secreted protein Hcp